MAAAANPTPDACVQETNFTGLSDPDLAEDTEEQAAAIVARHQDSHQGRHGGTIYGSFPADDGAATAPAAPAAATVTTIITTTGKPRRALVPDLLRGLLMPIMAMDHAAIMLAAWQHGTGGAAEADGAVVREWNRPVAYVVRTLTHLCAPGFTFLLGMGVVYFGRSRARLGWSRARMLRHFLVRAAVLSLVSFAFGLLFTVGQVWFMNVMLVALGVNYLLAGALWLLLEEADRLLVRALARPWMPGRDDGEHQAGQSLLPHPVPDGPSKKSAARASAISWHFHNGLLFVLTFVTIWWNIWLSPDHGHCGVTQTAPVTEPSDWPFLWKFWFWPYYGTRVMSNFPPLAWTSFAVLGVLYGRLLLARPWSARTLSVANAGAGAACLSLFVLTRLLHFGNLSEGCLQTPEQLAHPDANPYLVSAASFLYITKYPPDVAFFAFTMAANFFLLALFNAIPTGTAQRLKPLLVYGTSALFFYIFHMIILMVLSTPVKNLFGHEMDFPDQTGMKPGLAFGVDNLWAYFGTWAVMLVIIYWLCKWYGAFKHSKGPDSIWRFF